VEDDQYFRNVVTVQRSDGGQETAEDAASVAKAGRMPMEQQVSLSTDVPLVHHAHWRLHVRSGSALRYSTLVVDLSRDSGLLPVVQRLIEGDLVRIENLPSQHPAGVLELLIEGVQEVLGAAEWRFTFNCSLADPYRVWLLEDPTYGRLSPVSSTLNGAVTATATSISVATTAGYPWVTTSTDATAFPFDIDVNGEVMQVTAIAGSPTTPQTMTLTRGVNGIQKEHATGTPVNLAQPAVLAL
jgi:hypothetical protein